MPVENVGGSGVSEGLVNTLITTAVNNLVNAAPGALDTLDELALALGDDANFATTVTNALAAKASSTSVANALAGKQDSLVNQTNIKSINGNPLLGSGDLSVGGATNFTYGETITAGNLVELKSDGKVYKINSTTVGAYQTPPFTGSHVGVFVANGLLFAIGESGANISIRCGSISGTTITWGTAVQLFAQTSSQGNCRLIYNASSGSYVIAYGDNANSSYLTFRAFTVSGTTITLGTAVVVTVANSNVVLSDSSSSLVVATYKGATGNTFVRTISISGTTLTLNTAVDTTLASIDDAVYVDSENRLYVLMGGQSIIRTYTRSTTTLTAEIYTGNLSLGGTPNLFYSSYLGKVIASNYSGSTLSLYTLEFATTVSSNDSIILKRISAIATWSLSAPFITTENNLLLLGRGTVNTSGSLQIKGISPKDSFNKENVISTNLGFSPSVVFISGNIAFVVGSYNLSGSATTKAVIVLLSNLFNYIGIASASGVLNESKEVLLSGKTYTTTGLTAGANYYVQLDGSYSTTPTGLYLGKAISTTQLLIG